MNLQTYVRDIPDFPKQGILFKDITTLQKDNKAFRFACDQMLKRYVKAPPDKIVGIESRGFIFGSVMAYQLNCGFIVARKPGKLPATTISQEYALEYGTNTLELHQDAILPEEKVVIVDDLLATGGTAQAVVKLVEQLGGKVTGIEFLIELAFLGGRDKLPGYPVFSQITYPA